MAIEKIKNSVSFINKILSPEELHQVIRLLLNLSFSSTGSGFILAPIINYIALFFYCIDLGIRIPVEGVPYLSFFVLLFGTLFLILFSIISSCFFGLIYGLSWYINSLITQKSENEKVHPIEIVVSIIGTIILSLTMIISFMVAAEINLSLEQLFLYASTIAIVVCVYYFWSDELKTTCSFLFPIILMFLLGRELILDGKEHLEKFLTYTKFGGNISVSYSTTTKEDSMTETILLLRTNEYFVFYDKKNELILEYPLSSIKKIEYNNNRHDWYFF